MFYWALGMLLSAPAQADSEYDFYRAAAFDGWLRLCGPISAVYPAGILQTPCDHTWLEVNGVGWAVVSGGTESTSSCDDVDSGDLCESVLGYSASTGYDVETDECWAECITDSFEYVKHGVCHQHTDLAAWPSGVSMSSGTVRGLTRSRFIYGTYGATGPDSDDYLDMFFDCFDGCGLTGL